jgi:23S rRNA (adenine2503-C2)-methyltransferase
MEPTMALPLVFDAPRRARPPAHLADLGPAQLRAAVADLGLPGFRADQLARQYFGRFENDPARMSDLPASVRQRLGDGLLPPLLTEVGRRETDLGTTRKTLWRLFDGSLVESVLMHYPATASSRERVTLCVSSQAGCGMACPFCATGQGGLTRNLSSAEIVDRSAPLPGPRPTASSAGSRAGSPTSCSWGWANRWRTTRESRPRCAG